MENRRSVKIIIKNVTGSVSNECCLDELQRVGVYEGTIIEDGFYNPVNKSVQFSKGCENCVAWVGETCEIVENNERVN